MAHDWALQAGMKNIVHLTEHMVSDLPFGDGAADFAQVGQLPM